MLSSSCLIGIPVIIYLVRSDLFNRAWLIILKKISLLIGAIIFLNLIINIIMLQIVKSKNLDSMNIDSRISYLCRHTLEDSNDSATQSATRSKKELISNSAIRIPKFPPSPLDI